MGLSKILDKIGDALVPKEIAPFLGPAAMMFAGPLGTPLALGLGQLGSIKMHSGQLDPMTALGTVMSARAFNAANPDYVSVSDRIGSGIGSFNDPTKVGMGTAPGQKFTLRERLSGFGEGFQNVKPSATGASNRFKRLEKFGDTKAELGKQLDKGIIDKNRYDIGLEKATEGLKFGDRLIGKGTEFFDAASGKLFPGFGNFNDSIATLASVTTFTQMKPMAEELKKARIKDEKEEAKLWTEWFDKYKGFTGYDYSESKAPDPFIADKYNKYKHLLANGGRVGYNMGGDTGIIAAAPGMPQGMQLDGRDGIFVSQGIEEKADDVPAMLSKNEFVLTADAMKGFDKMTGGSGNPREAAQKMYQLMDQMEAIA